MFRSIVLCGFTGIVIAKVCVGDWLTVLALTSGALVGYILGIATKSRQHQKYR